MPNKPASKNDPFKGIKTGAWSKYCGARHGLIHSQAQPTWWCQCCREEQPKELPGFFVEHDSGEMVKLCAKCFSLARQVQYSFHQTKIIIKTRYRD